MTVAGLVKNRKHQFGRQSAFGTPVAAVAQYPYKGTPTPDLGWTDRDIDEGSIDPVAAPIRGAHDLTTSLTDPGVEYNSLPLKLSAIFGDGVIAVGAGDDKTWTYEPASRTVDAVDVFTYEFGDDVTSDWFQYGDSILESLELTGPSGLGAWTSTESWRHGSIASSGSTDLPDSPAVPTAGLTLDPNPALVYLKDTSIFIASDYDDIDDAGSQIQKALINVTLRVTVETDQKRWADGTQSFNVQEYARAKRMIELVCRFEKTADTVGIGSESDAWMSDTAVTRFVKVVTESKELIDTGPDVPYSWFFELPLRYYTRTDEDEGGNAVIVLTGRAFVDDGDFDGVFRTEVVCTRASI